MHKPNHEPPPWRQRDGILRKSQRPVLAEDKLPADRCVDGRKIRYSTEITAKAAVVGAVISFNRGKTKRHEIRYYECRHCRGWHLTSKKWKRP